MIEIGRLTRLILGYVGETNSRVIEIDASEWLRQWTDAAIAVWIRRPDKEGYWAATEVQDGVLRWTVTAGDVAQAGDGMAQVMAIDRGTDAVFKSRTVGTKIYASLEEMTSDPDAPDPMEAWANQAASYKADAEKARTGAESAQAEAMSASKTAVEAQQDATKEAARAAKAAENAEAAAKRAEDAAASGGGGSLSVDANGDATIGGTGLTVDDSGDAVIGGAIT